MTNGWFEVDKEGLAKLLERRGKAYVIYELLQNAWDTDAKKVEATLVPPNEEGVMELTVKDDDPDGFKFLHHAWTLFAESSKKGDPEKRGRFNLGEKLVLAVCERAMLITTKGTVAWDATGRHGSKESTRKGSVFAAEILMDQEDYEEVLVQIQSLIPPKGVKTSVNGKALPRRKPAHAFEVQLPTEISDEEGYLRNTRRVTEVEVYEVPPGQKAAIYEMGIPVVETDDRWHVNVMQKVPLNSDRDNVTPGYLQKVRTALLNEMHDRLKGEEEATETWVRAASADKDAKPEAVTKVMSERFGKKRVVVDPSDPEGTKIAMSKGYSVVFPGSLSKGEWGNVRSSGAILPAGQVTPSPKPYSSDGRPEKVIPREKWTRDMHRIAEFAQFLCDKLFEVNCHVKIVREPQVAWGANYGQGELCLNYGRLGRNWFARQKRDEEVVDLLIHEFVHHTVLDHLSEKFHKMATRLGARCVGLALDYPEEFQG
jgi:hypothetical protein